MEQVNTSRSGSTAGFLSVFFISAAVIAYEIAVMKIFSVGNWSHFGSMAISIAMFGFGVFSVILCVFKDFLKRNKTAVLSIKSAKKPPALTKFGREQEGGTGKTFKAVAKGYRESQAPFQTRAGTDVRSPRRGHRTGIAS